MSNLQRTLMLVKPDGVKRGLIGEVLGRFEKKGFTFPEMKIVLPNKDILKDHYAEHAGKPYYSTIEMYMTMGPMLVFVVEGHEAVAVCRKMLGATRPENAEPGTIRFDLANNMNQNVCHASDSLASAEREIKIWFG